MIVIDCGKFRPSLKHLEEQKEYRRTCGPVLSEITRVGIAESVFQRFNSRFDYPWECWNATWSKVSMVPTCRTAPSPCFALPVKSGRYLRREWQWLQCADARTSTSHDQDGEHARECLNLTPNFLDDTIGLYQTIIGATWQ